MRYVWDPKKRDKNLRKHGVAFVDAIATLEDSNGLTKIDTESNEYRFKTLGVGARSNVLLVVHAEENEDSIVIISARKADKAERQQYYEGLIDE